MAWTECEAVLANLHRAYVMPIHLSTSWPDCGGVQALPENNNSAVMTYSSYMIIKATSRRISRPTSPAASAPSHEHCDLYCE